MWGFVNDASSRLLVSEMPPSNEGEEAINAKVGAGPLQYCDTMYPEVGGKSESIFEAFAIHVYMRTILFVLAGAYCCFSDMSI